MQVLKHSPSQGPMGMGWEVRAAWLGSLTKSRCITWSWVMLPYLVAFFMGCGRKEGRKEEFPALAPGGGAQSRASSWSLGESLDSQMFKSTSTTSHCESLNGLSSCLNILFFYSA